MLYEDSFIPAIYDCKIYMKQKTVTMDLAVATKADAKTVYLHSYGGVDVSLLEGYPNPGFSPKCMNTRKTGRRTTRRNS